MDSKLTKVILPASSHCSTLAALSTLKTYSREDF